MSAHNGSIEHHIFIVVITGQKLENALEDASFGPPVEALVHDLPVAKACWQIAPRNARPISIKNRIDEQSVVRCVTAHMPVTARQKIFDPFPLIVAQSKTLHGRPLRKTDHP